MRRGLKERQPTVWECAELFNSISNSKQQLPTHTNTKLLEKINIYIYVYKYNLKNPVLKHITLTDHTVQALKYTRQNTAAAVKLPSEAVWCVSKASFTPLLQSVLSLYLRETC